jgi:hypothetical protein
MLDETVVVKAVCLALKGQDMLVSVEKKEQFFYLGGTACKRPMIYHRALFL